MKRNYFLMGMFAIMLLLQACFKEGEPTDEIKARENDEQIRQYLADNPDITAQSTAEGLHYWIYSSNPQGRLPQPGEQVYVKYVGRLLNGPGFDSSKIGKPLIYGLNNGAIIPGFNQGISMMRIGEKARLFVPSYLAYGSASNTNIPAYSVLDFDVTLEDALPENLAIQKYIKQQKLDSLFKDKVIAKNSGLIFISTNPPTGTVLPQSGQEVTVSYKGFYLSGFQFDESKPDKPFKFIIGTQGAIKGFEEGISMMKKGEKATLLMPSSLGYGTTGSSDGSIPPYTPLIFEVTLEDIK